MSTAQCWTKALLVAYGSAFFVVQDSHAQEKNMDVDVSVTVRLPAPKFEGRISVEQALHERRSVREYKRNAPLTLEEVSQLLWAAQGITSSDGHRTAPSAGALYPLEVYIVAGNVRNLEPGVYQYRPREHNLVRTMSGDIRKGLRQATLDQEQVEDAPVTIVFCAVYDRTTGKYGERGKQYVHYEIGHAAQNIFLQVVALGLGTVPIGAFVTQEVKRALMLPHDETPLYLMPVGKK